MKKLPQIVATFLALGATFFAAYFIYLNSSQANVDQKIQIEGAEIANRIKTAPIYEMPFFASPSLLKKYQDKYPDKSFPFLLEMIAIDLHSAGLYKIKDSVDRLASFEKDNRKGPVLGRIFIWLIGSSVDYLAPSEVNWPGRGYIKSFGFIPPTQQLELFPFGPYGAEQWSNDFQIIRYYIYSLDKDKEIFLNDFKLFIEQLDENDSWTKEYKKYLTKINYKDWSEKMTNVLSEIETNNNRIQSLLMLRKNYSIEESIPHRNLIFILGVLCFISGIMIPLIFSSFKLEDSVPPVVDILIVIITFIFLFSGIFYLGKDISSAHKRNVHVKYLVPLQKQLSDYKTKWPQKVTFNYDIVNQIIYNKKSFELPQELFKILEQYKEAVIDSNTCSEQIVGILTEVFQQSVTLKSYMADPLSGGQAVSIIGLLSAELRKSFFEKLYTSSDNFILEADYEKSTTIIFKIKPPRNKEELDKVVSEIDRIYNRCSAYPDVQGCMSKRKKVENLRDRLLQEISKIIRQ